MILPFRFDDILRLDETPSTQDYAEAIVRGEHGAMRPHVVFTKHQSKGRGRFDRVWQSSEGDSLTASLICWNQADHPAPHLIGMSVAVAAALTFEAHVQWPNDIVAGGKKLGGILANVVADPNKQKITIVGLGVNLNQMQFDRSIAERATSVRLQSGTISKPTVALENVLGRLCTLQVPISWIDLAPFWRPLDRTQGKRFLTASGVEIVANGVGDQGELIYHSENGIMQHIYAADAC